MQSQSVSIHRIIFLLTLAFVILVTLAPNSALEFLRVQYGWVNSIAEFMDSLMPGVDVDHLSAFIALGFAVRFGWPGRKAWQVALGMLLLAAVTELVQLWVPGRVASPFHALTDVLGGLAGFLLAWLMTFAWGGGEHLDDHQHTRLL
jgi:hypothetical protein